MDSSIAIIEKPKETSGTSVIIDSDPDLSPDWVYLLEGRPFCDKIDCKCKTEGEVHTHKQYVYRIPKNKEGKNLKKEWIGTRKNVGWKPVKLGMINNKLASKRLTILDEVNEFAQDLADKIKKDEDIDSLTAIHKAKIDVTASKYLTHKILTQVLFRHAGKRILDKITTKEGKIKYLVSNLAIGAVKVMDSLEKSMDRIEGGKSDPIETDNDGKPLTYGDLFASVNAELRND